MSDALGKVVFDAVWKALNRAYRWDWVEERHRAPWVAIGMAGRAAARAAWSDGQRGPLLRVAVADAMRRAFDACIPLAERARDGRTDEFSKVWAPSAAALLAALETMKAEARAERDALAADQDREVAA